MGVPKFYRWISERYPCLSDVVREHQMPEFDNLYLDMNGIIHNCSHPNDNNPHFRITEEKIFTDIFHYLEVLFRLIKPRKVFFIAVDGVAPRAKMNQQRGRRFRSAQDAEKQEKAAREKGEVLPNEARFDSNCITPGTEFMAKLQEQLKYFLVKMITTDKMWQGPRVYLSGHEVPGEGEHKIMDFIRSEKSKPGYDENTRHCLYGLDADLMMLGLSSHEPHFALLREEVKFGKNDESRIKSVEEINFHLLHLTLFREYLDYEFSELKDTLPFGYDLERIIDDWVLMGFLVGNDFVPHLPHFHIETDALPRLWGCYKKVLPTLDGYLHDGGTLNLPRFEKYLTELSKHDVRYFADVFDDLKYLKGKRAAAEAANKKGDPETSQDAELEDFSLEALQFELEDEKVNPNFSAKKRVDSLDSFTTGILSANQFLGLLKQPQEEQESPKDLDKVLCQDIPEALKDVILLPDDNEDAEFAGTGDLPGLMAEFRRHKNAYYTDKMGICPVTQQVLQNQASEWVRAIQWILNYYYNGCISWSWFYPAHYAPYLSDVKNFSDLKLEFNMETPFRPFEQLMAVLPAASKTLLPEPLHKLMTHQSSPILDFYPREFDLDMNGKKMEWEAVVLIPFIEEKRLLAAMRPEEGRLTDEEKARNTHGHHLLLQYTTDCQGTYPSSLPNKFPDIVAHKAKMTQVHKDAFRLKPHEIFKGLCRGVGLDVYFQGFPTLKHLPHTFKFERAEVKVFQHKSRNESIILHLNPEEPVIQTDGQDLRALAEDLIGRQVYVQWPHLFPARVVALSDGVSTFTLVEPPMAGQKNRSNSHISVKQGTLEARDAQAWATHALDLATDLKTRRGVDIGEPQVLLYCTLMTGRKYTVSRDGGVAVESQWTNNPLAFPLHACTKNIKVKQSNLREYSSLKDLYEKGTDVFMLGQPYYGCQGQVVEVSQEKDNNRVRVTFIQTPEPNLRSLSSQRLNAEMYYRSWEAADRLGVNSHLVSRVSGTMYVCGGSSDDPLQVSRGQQRTNIGFNLKFNKTGKQVPGYSKKDPNDNQWTYSARCVELMHQYMSKFPKLFDHIARHTNEDNFYADDVFGKGKGDETTKAVKEYLKSLPFSSVEPAPFGTEVVGEQGIALIERQVNAFRQDVAQKRKRIKMQVKPHLLHKPNELNNNVVPDPSACYELWDRVVNVREGFSVPLGLRGTVVGIMEAAREQDRLYEVLFDEDFVDGLSIRGSSNRAYRLPSFALINLTHGERKTTEGKGGRQTTSAWDNTSFSSSFEQSPRRNGGNHRGRSRGSPAGGRQMSPKKPVTAGGSGAQPQIQKPHQQPQPQPQLQILSRPPQAQQTGRDNNSQDMFLGMWNQLQQSKDFPDTWKSPSASSGKNESQNQQEPSSSQFQPHSKRGPPMPSLHDAAAALSKGYITGPQVSLAPPGHRIDVATLFSTASATNFLHIPPQPTEPAQGSASTNSESDMNRLMNALHIREKNEPTQEGTQALHQLLKIGQDQGQSDVIGNADAAHYGQQVSVQELLGGSAGMNQNNTQPSQKQKKQTVQQKKNSMTALIEYCAAHGLTSPNTGPPRYDFQADSSGRIIATVSVSDLVFQGSWTRDKQHATESAASVALFNLQQQPGLVGMRAPPGMAMRTPTKPGQQTSPSYPQHPAQQGPPPAHQATHPNQNVVQSAGQENESYAEDTARFAPSPNSAFTPFKDPHYSRRGSGQNRDRRHGQHGPNQRPHHRGQPFPNPPFVPNTPQQPQQYFSRQFVPQHQQGQQQLQNSYTHAPRSQPAPFYTAPPPEAMRGGHPPFPTQSFMGNPPKHGVNQPPVSMQQQYGGKAPHTEQHFGGNQYYQANQGHRRNQGQNQSQHNNYQGCKGSAPQFKHQAGQQATSGSAYSSLRKSQQEFGVGLQTTEPPPLQRKSSDEGRASGEDDKSQPNPFVPLQVMRKQHTPRKDDSQESGTDVVTERINEETNFQDARKEPVARTTKRKAKQQKSGGRQCSSDADDTKVVSDNKAREKYEQTEKKRPQRQKCRIAAKFFDVPESSES